MGKHAYLILAHNNYYVLEKLLRLLDDPRNDIYIHIDKKVKDFDFCYFGALCRLAQVRFSKKRVDIGWAKPSMVKAELELFRLAAAHGPYGCYHLISGTHLPLKTQDEIHARCEDLTVSHLCYGSAPTKWELQRMTRFHNVIPGKNRISRKLNGILSRWQEKLGVDRLKRRGMKPYKGGQWGSFPQEAVEYLLKNEKKIRRMIRFSSCPDEVYKQVILINGGYAVDPEDWLYLVNVPPNPSPITFTEKDFDTLISQENKLFARKFMEDVDKRIVDRIYDHLRRCRHGADPQ